jgi:hypothetical protein
MAELVSGLLDRESQHLAMVESLNDRDEVFAKLIGLNARINFEFAVLMERPDLADEIRRTVDMAGLSLTRLPKSSRGRHDPCLPIVRGRVFVNGGPASACQIDRLSRGSDHHGRRES